MLDQTRPPGNPNWKPGVSGNSSGRGSSGMQSVSDRLAYWLETKTVDEIAAIVRNKKEWGKLTAIDGVVVRRIHAAMQKAGSNPDFTAVLDRFVGRPVQPISAEFKHTHGLADRLKKAMAIVDDTSDAILIEQVIVSPDVMQVEEKKDEN